VAVNPAKVKGNLPSWSMGTSKRDNPMEKSKVKVPGPGAYDAKIVKGSAPAYGLRGRDDPQHKTMEVPGPGKYSPNTKKIETAITHGFTFSGGRSASVESLKNSPKSSKNLPPGPGNYDIGSTIDKKHGAPFGTEKRNSREEKSFVPGPGAYSSVQGESMVMSKNPTAVFGKSKRDGPAKVKVVPGPGAYDSKPRVGKEGKKFSLSGRPKSCEKTRNASPGPGAYNQSKEIIEEKPKNIKFGNEKRESEIVKLKVPGPGQYETLEVAKKLKSSSPKWG